MQHRLPAYPADPGRQPGIPPAPWLGRFPVEHVDDFADKLPDDWRSHGGVFVPMYQSEALWINFSGHYPCAVKIAAGKINAVSGESWRNGLSDDPQDYAVIPEQPWLDLPVTHKSVRLNDMSLPLGNPDIANDIRHPPAIATPSN